MYSVIEASDLHTDYTHMNENGYCKLAEAWYVAIGVVLGCRSDASTAPPVRNRVVPYPEPMLRTLTASGAGLLAALVVPSVACVLSGRPAGHGPTWQPRLGSMREEKASPTASSARRWPCRSTTTIPPERRSTSR